MNSLRHWFRFSSEQITRAQWLFSIGVVVVVSMAAVYLINDGRRLTRDVEDFFNGNSFKVLGEIANLQRDWLKTQVMVKDLRFDASIDLSEYSQQYAFAKISLGIINSRANSEQGIENFADHSFQLLDRLNELTADVDRLGKDLELVAGDSAAMAPILDEMDASLNEAELLINGLYVAQEAFSYHLFVRCCYQCGPFADYYGCCQRLIALLEYRHALSGPTHK